MRSAGEPSRERARLSPMSQGEISLCPEGEGGGKRQPVRSRRVISSSHEKKGDAGRILLNLTLLGQKKKRRKKNPPPPPKKKKRRNPQKTKKKKSRHLCRRGGEEKDIYLTFGRGRSRPEGRRPSVLFSSSRQEMRESITSVGGRRSDFARCSLSPSPSKKRTPLI